MRVLFMGQTGVDKKLHVESLATLCRERGVSVDVFHVGDMMYEASSKAIAEGKILDLPLDRLATLRRLAFQRINEKTAGAENVFVNSHAVFRWNNKLFLAYDISEAEAFRPDMIVTLVDDVEMVKARLEAMKSSGTLPEDTHYTLKDLMVWREEEILASEVLASVLKVPNYVLGVWLDPQVTATPLETVYSLVFQPWKKKTYVSYPISEALSDAELWERVLRYRRIVRSHLTAFDPLMIGEKSLRALYDANPSAQTVACPIRDGEVQLDTAEIADIIPDIDGQIEARDYKLIDQSDTVVAYFPVNRQGGPLIAGGVQSEIEYAHSATKDIIIVWECVDKRPTPFIASKADRMFATLDELEQFLKDDSKPTGQLEMLIDGSA